MSFSDEAGAGATLRLHTWPDQVGEKIEPVAADALSVVVPTWREYGCHMITTGFPLP